jgi:hypothetical protein
MYRVFLFIIIFLFIFVFNWINSMNAILQISIIMILGINGNLIGVFDRFTKYKGELSDGPWWLLMLYVFFGVFMFPFYKIIRRYRKEYDIEREILEHETWWGNMKSPFANDEYVQKKRWLKLQKISRKVKR